MIPAGDDYKAKMLFIVGAARSGTTYLVDVLGDLFDYGMGPEGHFVLDFAKRLPHYGSLSEGPNLERLLEDVRNASTLSIIRNEWPQRERFDVSVDELRLHVHEPHFAAVVYAVFRCIANHLGKANVATKNPSYTLALPLLDSLFSGRARYINLVRDGRDVALSTMSMSWGQNTAYACARAWRDHVRCARSFERQVGARRFHNVRYEDLVSDPQSVLDDLESFLDKGIEPKVKAAFVERALSNKLVSNFGKWRQAMPVRDIERFEAIAGNELADWNYERVFPHASIGQAESAWFECEELWRRILMTLRARKRAWRL